MPMGDQYMPAEDASFGTPAEVAKRGRQTRSGTSTSSNVIPSDGGDGGASLADPPVVDKSGYVKFGRR